MIKRLIVIALAFLFFAHLQANEAAMCPTTTTVTPAVVEKEPAVVEKENNTDVSAAPENKNDFDKMTEELIKAMETSKPAAPANPVENVLG